MLFEKFSKKKNALFQIQPLTLVFINLVPIILKPFQNSVLVFSVLSHYCSATTFQLPKLLTSPDCHLLLSCSLCSSAVCLFYFFTIISAGFGKVVKITALIQPNIFNQKATFLLCLYLTLLYLQVLTMHLLCIISRLKMNINSYFLC